MSEINNIKANGQAGLTSARNGNVRGNQEGDKKPEGQASTTSTDTVSLTGAATQLQALQQTLSDVPVVDSSRVEAIRTAIADGSYTVDASEVAQNMLSIEKQLS